MCLSLIMAFSIQNLELLQIWPVFAFSPLLHVVLKEQPFQTPRDGGNVSYFVSSHCFINSLFMFIGKTGFTVCHSIYSAVTVILLLYHSSKSKL